MNGENARVVCHGTFSHDRVEMEPEETPNGETHLGCPECGVVVLVDDQGDVLRCDVHDCEEPALARVHPTHGETVASALRCRECLLYDLDRDWFKRWAAAIEEAE